VTFIEKITSYDLFTSLIPGAFLVEAFRASGVPFVEASNLASWAFLAYALGIFCNRVVSLLLAPAIERFAPRDHSYSDYISATKSDQRIESLVEKATFYRSMLSGALVYLVGIAIFKFAGDFVSNPDFALPVAGCLAMILFWFSLLKQERYVASRVKKANE
jgi:hypothetical protein